MPWENLPRYIASVRRSLTSAQDSGLPADANAIEQSVLRDLIAKVRGGQWEDIDRFYAQYGRDTDTSTGDLRSGVMAFLDDLAECLIRMERAGRFTESRSSEPARSYYDYFLRELHLVEHYSWATLGGLQGRFTRQRDASRRQVDEESVRTRISRLEDRWVAHWLEFFRTNRRRYTEERLALWRFVLLNWRNFAEDDFPLGARATPLGWGVERVGGGRWYASLDAVDDLLSPADRTRAQEQAVASRRTETGTPDGFWIDIFNRHHHNFFLQFVHGQVCQQNFGQQLAGTRVSDEVHRSAITSVAEGDRLNLEESIPHWQQLRNSLMSAHEARFHALRQCYYRYWSLQQPAPSRSDHLENAGIYIPASGGWAVQPLIWRLVATSSASPSVPGQPSRSPACGCVVAGRGGRRTTITAAVRSLVGGI